jgi:hypothetical protein
MIVCLGDLKQTLYRCYFPFPETLYKCRFVFHEGLHQLNEVGLGLSVLATMCWVIDM